MRGMNKVLSRAAFVASMAVSSLALAQDANKAPVLEADVPWMPVIVSLVTLGGIAVVGFKNARRTHLD